MSESGQEMASPQIPDELLVEIFLRLPNQADLIRAAAVCVSFRRVVADRSFRLLYRKLHAPPLLGFLDRRNVFHPAAPPHSSAPAAGAAALAADFSFSFLPAPAGHWAVQDIRDGRVLLDRRRGRQDTEQWKIDIRGGHVLTDTDEGRRLVFTEMVVCDPLHRRYLLLPPIPDHLAASVDDPLKQEHRWCEIFFAPLGDDEETSFKVIWMAQCLTRSTTFVFSSSTGQWRAVPSQNWSDLFDQFVSYRALFNRRQYAHGCFYWSTDHHSSEKLLIFDSRRLEFSVVGLPSRVILFTAVCIATVEAGEDVTGIFVLAFDNLQYMIRRNNGGSSSQWQLEKTITLFSRNFYLVGSSGRHLFLHHGGCMSFEPGFFSLDIETFQLERVCYSEFGILCRHAYSNFPPSLLSAPTISSGNF